MTKTTSLTDQAYADIKQKIISGTYAPGVHYEAGQLSDDLMMSRTPVREALLRLQNEGILEIAPKKGIRIISLSATDLQDIYQIITALEVEAVGNLTALRPDANFLAPLYEAIRLMHTSLDEETFNDWSLADEQFHRSLFDLNNNTRLRQEGHQYRDLAQRAHFVALRFIDPEQKRKSIKSHMDLIHIIESGDQTKARKAHFEQRIRGAGLLVSIVDNYGLKLL